MAQSILTVLWIVATILGFGETVSAHGFNKRNLKLVERLKQQMKFQVNELPFGKDLPAVSMVNDEGKQFECSINSNIPPESQPRERRHADRHLDFEDVLKSLEGACATLRKGWWTYRWCHKGGIYQYHHESTNGPVTANHSLGTYDYFKKGSKGKTLHLFQNGQQCDNKKGDMEKARRTEVHFDCCRGSVDSRTSGENAKGQLQGSPSASASASASANDLVSFRAIDEPEPCQYKATLCTPLLCRPEFEEMPELKTLLQPLQNTCFQRHEGWWTYEFCYQKRVRQFHAVEEQKEGTKNKKQVIAVQYMLGLSPPPEDGADNAHDSAAAKANEEGRTSETPSADEPSRKKGGKMDSAHPDRWEDEIANQGVEAGGRLIADRSDPLKSVYRLDYKGGTPCFENGQGPTRSISIDLQCGPANAIQAVKEDYTCHYTMSFSTPLLCDHPLFRERVRPSQQVSCVEQQGHSRS